MGLIWELLGNYLGVTSDPLLELTFEPFGTLLGSSYWNHLGLISSLPQYG